MVREIRRDDWAQNSAQSYPLSTKNPVIITVSGRNLEKEERRKCKQAGIKDFLEWPVKE